MTPPTPEAPISSARKWAITFTVMVVAFMQILDTSVTNVILPHLQGSLSAGLDEVSWVITSYLAANAVVIPATGWLAGLFGRKRFFLICTTLFVVSSFALGRRPRPDHADHRAHLPGPRRRADHPALAGDPVGDLPVPPARARDGGVGRRLHPRADPGADRRRLPGRRVVVALDLLHQPAGRHRRLPHGAARSCSTRRTCGRPARIDWWGLGLMVAGFGCLQLVLDRGEREDWFDSTDDRRADASSPSARSSAS